MSIGQIDTDSAVSGEGGEMDTAAPTVLWYFDQRHDNVGTVGFQFYPVSLLISGSQYFGLNRDNKFNYFSYLSFIQIINVWYRRYTFIDLLVNHIHIQINYLLMDMNHHSKSNARNNLSLVCTDLFKKKNNHYY